MPEFVTTEMANLLASVPPPPFTPKPGTRVGVSPFDQQYTSPWRFTTQASYRVTEIWRAPLTPTGAGTPSVPYQHTTSSWPSMAQDQLYPWPKVERKLPLRPLEVPPARLLPKDRHDNAPKISATLIGFIKRLR